MQKYINSNTIIPQDKRADINAKIFFHTELYVKIPCKSTKYFSIFNSQFSIILYLCAMNSQTEIKYLSLVGEKRAAVLKKELNISSVCDLLRYFPFRHSELFYTIESVRGFDFGNLDGKMPLVQLQGKIHSVQSQYERTIAIFQDHTGSVQLVWFNMQNDSWLRQINPNVTQVLFGEIGVFNSKLQIVSPFFREISKYKLHNIKSKFQAIYHSN